MARSETGTDAGEMGQGLGCYFTAPLRTLRDHRVRSVPYTDAELLASGFFEYIKAGYTYPESVRLAGLCPLVFEHNMSFDLEMRTHIVNCSMTLTAYQGRHRREFLKIINVLSERADEVLAA